jgi:serine/threonine protein kinase
MTTRSHELFDDLTPEQRTQIEDRIDAFEQAWQKGERPKIGDYLPADEAVRNPLLLELVYIDLERRIKAGESDWVELYLGDFPELGEETGQVLALLAAEFNWRAEKGQVPDIEDYRKRFPELHEMLVSPLFKSVDDRETQSTLSSDVRSVAEAGREIGHFDPKFHGNDRFELGPFLGAGAMGQVYVAYDRQRQQRVALKILPRIDFVTLSRFKQEFRSLVGLTHPNLVTLYELFAEETAWYYTMERVEGRDFVSFFRSGKPQSLDAASVTQLRSALIQLVQGIAALHAAGKIHRDIKPLNVLITMQGRVVILDPGLVHEVEPNTLHPTEESFAGTVGYMAPEQADQKSTFASDFYSVGVMLYETLTGQLPFRGTVASILRDKGQLDPRPPGEILAGVPEDLNRLCQELLNRCPEDRPHAEAILERLKGSHTAPLAMPVQPTDTGPSAPGLFVGRHQQLTALRHAFDEIRSGHPVSLFVQGESGVGKSALIERFLSELKDNPEVVVLQGRCYERESVPYKALDSVADALSRYLRRLKEVELAPILPRNPAAVCQLFPVLGRVGLIGNGLERVPCNPDQRELRRQGTEGLRDLLERLGDRKRLVIYIDDLQWGDRDSALLIRRILAPPDPPVLFLVGCYRSADRSRSECLKALLGPEESGAPFGERRELTVEPLTEEEIRSLVTAIYQGDRLAAERSVEIVVRDCHGNPYYAAELTRFAREQTSDFLSSGDTLDNLLWRRVEGLPREARALIETIAVAGQPLLIADAWAAASLSAENQPALDLLCRQSLLRTSGSATAPTVEAYHDRVRETVVSHLAVDRRRDLHAILASTLEASDRTDPEVIGNHFRGSGNLSAAARHFASAATKAMTSLAFERAVALYRQSLDCLPPRDPDMQSLRIGLADALASAGRGREAAAQYLAAADERHNGDSINDLRRRAAEQYLISGHIREGTDLIDEALHDAGVIVPRSNHACLVVAALLTMWLRIRRPWRSKQTSFAASAANDAMETAWSAARGLALINPLRSFVAALQVCRHSAHCENPDKQVAAWSFYAAHLSTSGSKTARFMEEALAASHALAESTSNSYAHGMIALAKAMAAYLRGEWTNSISASDSSLAYFQRSTKESVWEKDTLHIFALWAMTFRGDTSQLRSRGSALLQSSVDRNDLFMQTLLQTYIMSIVRLCDDDPKRARNDIDASIRSWNYRGFHNQHHNILLAETLVDLYRGQGATAFERLTRASSFYRLSEMRPIQHARIQFRAYRATAALSAATQSGSQRYLRQVRQETRRLRRERAQWATMIADLLTTAVNSLEGKPFRIEDVHGVIQGLDKVELGYHSAAALIAFGKVAPRMYAGELSAAGYQRMKQMDVQNPDRFAMLFCPISRPT